MDATRVSVVLGIARDDIADPLGRLVDGEGNGHVIGIARHPVETAELVRRLRPDVVVTDYTAGSGTSILSFLKSFVTQERLLAIIGDERPNPALDGVATPLTVAEIVHATRSGELPAAFSRAYLSALRDKRARDIKTIEALAAMAEVREASSPASVGRAADIAVACLQQIEPALAESEDVRAGFVLHDVGKIVIPESILMKESKLDDEEWLLMEKHPELGVELVRSLDLAPAAIDVIRHHHERWDGSGYPGHLSAEEIPLPARVFSVADAFESMTSNRPYRAAMSQPDALQIIKVHAGGVFDEAVVDVLLSVTNGGDGHERVYEIDLTG